MILFWYSAFFHWIRGMWATFEWWISHLFRLKSEDFCVAIEIRQSSRLAWRKEDIHFVSAFVDVVTDGCRKAACELVINVQEGWMHRPIRCIWSTRRSQEQTSGQSWCCCSCNEYQMRLNKVNNININNMTIRGLGERRFFRSPGFSSSLEFAGDFEQLHQMTS